MAAKRSRAPLSRACKKPKVVAQHVGRQPVAHPVAAAQAQLPPLNQQLIPAQTPSIRPAQNFRLPIELMLKIMSELDIFTARCWGLTCVQFNEEYKNNFDTYSNAIELLQFPQNPDVALMLVLPLSTWCMRFDGTYTNLMRCVYPTMPPHLWWNPATARFDSAETHRETTDRYMAVIRDKEVEREERDLQRREEKERRQLERAERNDELRGFHRDKIEIFMNDAGSDWDSNQSVSDDGVDLYSESESGLGTDSEKDDSEDEVATDDEEE
ncbi:hypothetical protein DL95DRAFT_400851 [Leptodontidium sp. 2 PMI_412]|nr:hypothetical protein DL95DRAFT_400851 [Leptodontidium sp. 2 PMI_412]